MSKFLSHGHFSMVITLATAGMMAYAMFTLVK